MEQQRESITPTREPRFNLWKRLAIVMTVLGLTGGTLTIHVLTMGQQSDFSMQLEKLCLHGFDQIQDQYPEKDYTKEREKCVSDAILYNATTPTAGQVFRFSLVAASGLVVVGWLLFGIIFLAVRWILRGKTE